MNIATVKSHIRDVPDFPKPGIVFRDITPLLAHAGSFRWTIERLREQVSAHRPDGIVAIESRGFIFGAALAAALELPLQLVRKPGKLPYRKIGVTYELEYGADAIEAHEDAFLAGSRYAIVDDLIATGGTAAATASLIRSRQGDIACCAFVIELDFLHGRDKLAGYPVESLLHYDSE
ncbi:MAG TPA: adenine phosphoribosyltransferase [Gammaproteobacteria bacterium]|jgi:adenine phosphoribosyltransferase|nr:adenine phosphoribosyltransferase [Gammaproteobacteria bacterium]